MPLGHRALIQAAGSGLAGRRKRPSSLRVQSRLSHRSSRSRGCFHSGCFRGFLRRRLLGCRLFRRLFLSRLLGYLFRRFFLSCCFFFRRLFLGYFLSRLFLSRCFFRRSFLGCYFLSGPFLSCCFFRRSFLGCYFLSRRFFRCCFFSRSFLCGLFCGRFFCSCHHFLLDQVTKSTPCQLVCMKRFMMLGSIPTP
jgi:hypothetical protein